MLRGSKYNACPTRCSENVMHQSRAESRRCTELHLMQKGGLIRNLEAHPQVRFRLDVDGHHICEYLADFVYFDNERSERVVEDVKGHQTEVSKFKLRLMAAIHGVTVELVRNTKGRVW